MRGYLVSSSLAADAGPPCQLRAVLYVAQRNPAPWHPSRRRGRLLCVTVVHGDDSTAEYGLSTTQHFARPSTSSLTHLVSLRSAVLYHPTFTGAPSGQTLYVGRHIRQSICPTPIIQFIASLACDRQLLPEQLHGQFALAGAVG